MPFNSFSKTSSFNVYLSVLALLKPAAPVRLSTLNSQLPTFHLLQTPNIPFCLKKNSENYNFQALKFNYFSYLYSDIYSMLKDGEENCRKIAGRSGLSR